MTRLIPSTWFTATTHNTSMSFLKPTTGTERDAPLAPGERMIGWFVLPTYQRPLVWTMEQKIRFIESCWMGLPIGAFVFNRVETPNSPFDNLLLDGQQRVSTVYEYMDDGFPVLGYHYSQLTVVDHRRWTMSTQFPSMQTSYEDDAMLRDVYDRLAYGGTPQEPKEI